METSSYLASDCENCALCTGCRSVLIQPRGSDHPTVLIVGEAPGPEEDKKGTPFVGASGKLLSQLLLEAGIPEEKVRITNTVRCFPNIGGYKIRPPKKEEIEACLPYLKQEIEHVRPKIIVCLGSVSTKALLGKKVNLKRFRGMEVPYQLEDGTSVPVVPTYHPAYVLRGQSEARGLIVSDLKYVKSLYKPSSVVERTTDYKLITKRSEVKLLVDTLLDKHKKKTLPFGEIAVDLETSSLRRFDPASHIVSAQIAWDRGKAVLIPVIHTGFTKHEFHSPEGAAFLRGQLALLLESGIPVSGHNFAFDYTFLYAKLGIKTKNIVYDGMLAHHCLRGGSDSNTLDYMASRYVNFPPYKRKVKAMIEDGQLQQVPIEELVDYGCGDADATLQLSKVICKKLRNVGRWELYETLYMKSLKSLIKLEIDGVRLDPVYLQSLDPFYTEIMRRATEIVQSSPYHKTWSRMNRVENKKRVVRGKVNPSQALWSYPLINLGSWQQVQSLLYEVMEMSTTDGRGKTNESTDDTRLREHGRDAYEGKREDALTVIRAILQFRNAQKRRSSYVHKLLRKPESPQAQVHNQGQKSPHPTRRFEPDCGVWRVHPQYNQAKVVTGRLSATDPPIQTFPRGSPIRRAMIPDQKSEGLILKADFSQMELRVLACLAGDERLIAVLGGKDPRFKQYKSDIHLYTASVVFKKPPEEVTKEERHRAKEVSFGIIYGRGAPAIAEATGMTVEDAEDLIASYFKMFPSVHKWVKRRHRDVHERGYVIGPTGRMYSIPDGKLFQKTGRLTFAEDGKLAEAERFSVNYPIQGGASDVCLDSLNRLVERWQEDGAKTRPFTVVHDSIECMTVVSELRYAYDLLQSMMLGDHGSLFKWLTVPLKVEFELGTDWQRVMDCEFDGDKLILSGNSKYYPALRRRLLTHYKISEEEIVSTGITDERSKDGPRLKLEDIEDRQPYEKVKVVLTLKQRRKEQCQKS